MIVLQHTHTHIRSLYRSRSSRKNAIYSELSVHPSRAGKHATT
jgi:hypothetical protein